MFSFAQTLPVRWVKVRNAMCKQCVEIDGKIQHYDLLASRVTDRTLLDGLQNLIELLQALKVALHSEKPTAPLGLSVPSVKPRAPVRPLHD
jgi:hypothetical protein